MLGSRAMNPAAKIVEDYLRALMIPDPAAA
jgi:hypothetical protein